MSESGAEPTEAVPDQSTDDTDAGWGELPDEDDDERLLRDKPPHY
jgi:hypothetical protein